MLCNKQEDLSSEGYINVPDRPPSLLPSLNAYSEAFTPPPTLAPSSFPPSLGTGITGCKQQTGGGPGTFFTTSDPAHTFYFYGFQQPLFAGLPTGAESGLVGRAQMFFNNASTDLVMSEDCPYADPIKVLACVAWEMPAPQPPHIFTAGEDGNIRSWSFHTEQARFVVGSTYVGHTRAVTALILAATENPPLLYSAGLDGTIRCWNCLEFASRLL